MNSHSDIIQAKNTSSAHLFFKVQSKDLGVGSRVGRTEQRLAIIIELQSNRQILLFEALHH